MAHTLRRVTLRSAAEIGLSCAQQMAAADAGPDTSERDWALLRAFQQCNEPAYVYEHLALSGFVEADDEEWDAMRVEARRKQLCKNVKLVLRMIGSAQPMHRLQSLADLCK